MRGREARRRREDALATGVVAGVTALTAIGSWISSDYDSAWFRALRKPRWEPSGAVIGPVWAVLYVCTALSASLLWRKRDEHDLRGLMRLFALQYLLNDALTPLLTLRRSLSLSTVDSAALHLAVETIIALAWPVQRAAAVLMLPYSAWTFFTTLLSWRVWTLNRT
jgi:translocator protein